MKKIWHLATCATNRRIIQELGGLKDFEFQEIKSNPIQPDQLDSLKERIGSYEALFSRKSTRYKEMGLKDRNLSESEMRALILSHYSFLKRPVILIGEAVFAGSDPATIAAVKSLLT